MRTKWFLSILLAVVAFVTGYVVRPSGGAGAKNDARKPLYYHDPMHPAYKSDKPGIAPDCGMQLEPVYAEDVAGGGDEGASLPPGAVRVSVDRQQVMGLRTAAVSRSSGAHTLRLLGRVAPDDTRVYRVTALAEGVVEAVSSLGVGNLVKRDDLLAEYFVATQELYNAFQGFFLAMNARAQGVALVSGTPAQSAQDEVKLSEDLLRVYGLSETQIREIGTTRQASHNIQFRAPVDGLILLRDAALGQKLERGKEIFRVADLRRVWVLVDVFEGDSGLVRPGLAARVRYRDRS